MEKGRSSAETILNLPNPGAQKREHEAGIEDSISEWILSNSPSENYTPPVLSADELKNLQTSTPTDSNCSTAKEQLPSRRLQLLLSEAEEDTLLRFRRSFVRYPDDEWLPTDEEILKAFLEILRRSEPVRSRILCSDDLVDALSITLRNHLNKPEQ